MRVLLRRFGSAMAVLEEAPARLRAAGLFRVAARLSRCDPGDGARALDAIAALGGRCVFPGDAGFPNALIEIPDPPLALFVRGDPHLHAPAVAIVGSRRATRHGRATAEMFAGALGRSGAVVVSGLALGIDGAAHRGALAAAAPTVAVLANGLDAATPRTHARLGARILASGGGWISEHAPGVSPRPYFFPERNRLIAGLARAVLVVEAREASGSLWSARHALDQGRDVFAVPGPIDTEAHRGSNGLLRDGAGVALDPDDLRLSVLGEGAAIAPVSGTDVSPEARRIWRLLADGPVDLESAALAAEATVASLAAHVTELELAGLVTREGTRISRRPGTAPAAD